MKIYMYAHGGSGNHGCEAIVRSTSKILKELGYERPILISANPAEDKKYGIDKICDIVKDKEPYSKLSFDFFKAYLSLKIKKDYTYMDQLDYMTTISKVKPGDIVLSIGGDNYCYADVKRYVMLHNMMRKRGAKTVLWGCSVEPELLENPEIAKDLSNYSLIVARESISYEALKTVNENTILTSDPAFFLDSSDDAENSNTVGINLSPMAIKNESESGLAMRSYRKLIQYIIDETDLKVVMIPHVIWDENDDRIPLKELYDEFVDTKRVEMISDRSCEEIKGVIKNCKYFVGARTHSTIAAYSTGVPTLVLGYSVKARGIAKDIFGSEDKYIIPVQKLKTEDDLLCEFKKVIENREDIISKLKDYRKFADNAIEKIKNSFKLLEE
ncbi:MAG: polysaccharide pyruvyl transferase family protein [Clostridia bacterium]|nr:polysaccharide pyruvyl transferase family protein [Clostridia bacterium]